MENNNKQVFLRLNEDNADRFADADFQLRSGVHIQEHKSQIKNYRFITDNEDELYLFYKQLYQIELCSHNSISGKFYYLNWFEEQKGKLKRKPLEPKHTLFAIFLYLFHKVEKRFSPTIGKQEVFDILNSHHKIKPHIHKLFLGSEQEDSTTTTKTISLWIDKSLSELEKLGWIYFIEDEDEKFEILSAFERIALIYDEAINNIDDIKVTTI